MEPSAAGDRVFVHGVALGVAVGALLATLILGLCVNVARSEWSRELDEAGELMASVEARAFDRGLATGRNRGRAETECHVVHAEAR
jgi:hypothetical protein